MSKLLLLLLIACSKQKGVGIGELNPLLTTYSRVFEERGFDAGLAFAKAVRGNFLNYLSGSSERIPGVALRASGIPKCFGPLARRIENEEVPTFGLRLLMTVLLSTRALKSKDPLPDTSPITEPLFEGSIVTVDNTRCKSF